MIKNRKKGILVFLFTIILIMELIVLPSETNATTYTQYTTTGISSFPESYQSALTALQALYPNWTFTAYYTGISWNDFITAETSTHGRNTVIKSSDSLWLCDCGYVASGYACASSSIIAYYSDPRNFLTESGIFQFLEMTYNSSSQTEAGVQSIIASTFMNTSVTFDLNGTTTTMTYAQIIMEAAKQSNMSPYSIAIKIIQEVGTSGSSSVSGTYVASDGTDYSGYYNFFNYGSYDSGDAIANGLLYAKEKGWTNPYIAIVEGAKLMADSYTNAGQNTAYFYKWDVVGTQTSELFWHQYMTNIQDPSSQAKSLYNTYAKNDLLSTSLNFIIPVFEDMPTANNLPTTIDTTLSSSYYLTGDNVRVRASASTSASILATLSKNTVVTVLEWNSTTANGYDWAQIQLSNGTIGYVANCYLAACNSETTSSEIAKIDGDYLIVVPGKTVQDVASALSATSYASITSSGEAVGAGSTLATGYIYNLNGTEYTVVVLGDVNGDGEVDVIDLALVKRHLMGTTTLENIYLKAGILQSGNTTIDVIDLALLKRHLMGTQSISL